jgi:hypothetical protein
VRSSVPHHVSIHYMCLCLMRKAFGTLRGVHLGCRAGTAAVQLGMHALTWNVLTCRLMDPSWWTSGLLGVDPASWLHPS